MVADASKPDRAWQSRVRPVRVVCMSKGRSDTIGKHTLKLFPNMTLVVDEKEVDDYAPLFRDEQIVTHKSLPTGIDIAIWIAEHFADEDIAYVGDDQTGLFAMPGWSARRYHDPEVAHAILQNACECATEAGAYVFGFMANPNPIIYEPYKPFHLGRWVAAPFGLRAGHGFTFDRRLRLMADIDTCLQTLLKHRIIWCDRRWCLAGIALQNSGGNAAFRSAEQFATEQAILKEKWGHYIRFDTEAVHSSERYKKGLPATTMMSYVYVPRTQPGF